MLVVGTYTSTFANGNSLTHPHTTIVWLNGGFNSRIEKFTQNKHTRTMCNYWKLKIREMGQAAGGEKSPRKSSCQTTSKGSVTRKKMRKQAHQRQELWQSLGGSTRRTRCGRMAPVVSMPRASPPHSRSSRRGRTVPIPDGLTAKILQSLLLEQRTILCLNFKGGMFKFYILSVFERFRKTGNACGPKRRSQNQRSPTQRHVEGIRCLARRC